MKVLFVCTGNTCRSPMAEALLRQRSPHFQVKSAGVFAGPSQAASAGSIQALREKGISLNHSSQPVTEELLSWADLVLTMTMNHKKMLLQQYPVYYEKVYTLKEYVDQDEQETWQKLKRAHAELEEKRASFVREKGGALTPQQLQFALQQHLQTELNEIQLLESQQPNYDISDPFGSSLDVYKKTLQEIEQYIELLVKKLDNKSN